MALINTLRKRMGKVVVGFVAFSMFAFILTDLFQSNSVLLGGNDTTIAEIAGKDISYEQFQAKVSELSYIFAINNQREPSSDEIETIRVQAWNALILDYAYKGQYDELGITVTNSEVVDMVQEITSTLRSSSSFLIPTQASLAGRTWCPSYSSSTAHLLSSGHLGSLSKTDLSQTVW